MSVIQSKKGVFRFVRIEEISLFRGLKSLLSALQAESVNDVIVYPGHIAIISKKRKRLCISSLKSDLLFEFE
jgi:hypothetical protein